MGRFERSSLVCDEVIKQTQSSEQVQACAKHADPPCEKSLVPRTWCVCLWGNNSPGLLTSSFGLLRFMTLSSAIQLLSLQLPFTVIGLPGSLGEEDEGEEAGKQLGWGGKLVRWNKFLLWPLQVTWWTHQHLTAPSRRTTYVLWETASIIMRLNLLFHRINKHCFRLTVRTDIWQ